MSRSGASRKPGWWGKVRRNKAQLLFWVLGLLVVLSMVLSLIIVALPQPEPPTPTPTPLSWHVEPVPFPRTGSGGL
ncbi:MAG: hypothetical protein ACP5UM_10135 [Anaerolineae bacterium]